ncbi:hypothetical protein CPB85DRAFT_359552 [Mucidula mucida]|nr:hypothetical protein CPB85DRAFT_359552 [Mucidula mucida]
MVSERRSLSRRTSSTIRTRGKPACSATTLISRCDSRVVSRCPARTSGSRFSRTGGETRWPSKRRINALPKTIAKRNVKLIPSLALMTPPRRCVAKMGPRRLSSSTCFLSLCINYELLSASERLGTDGGPNSPPDEFLQQHTDTSLAQALAVITSRKRNSTDLQAEEQAVLRRQCEELQRHFVARHSGLNLPQREELLTPK